MRPRAGPLPWVVVSGTGDKGTARSGLLPAIPTDPLRRRRTPRASSQLRRALGGSRGGGRRAGACSRSFPPQRRWPVEADRIRGTAWSCRRLGACPPLPGEGLPVPLAGQGSSHCLGHSGPQSPTPNKRQRRWGRALSAAPRTSDRLQALPPAQPLGAELLSGLTSRRRPREGAGALLVSR